MIQFYCSRSRGKERGYTAPKAFIIIIHNFYVKFKMLNEQIYALINVTFVKRA